MKRLIISLLIVVLVATIGFGWTLDRLFTALNKDAGDLLTNHQIHGQQLANLLDVENPTIPVSPIEQVPAAAAAKPELVILDLESLPLPDELLSNLTSGKSLALESDEGVTLYYFLPLSEQVLSYSPPAFRQLQQQNRQRLYFTMVFYAGLITLLLLWLYPLVTRLLNLSRVARKFGLGDFSARVKNSSRSYIADIETEFNRMANRIETLISDNKLLTSAVSHDLRTPIARLRFGIDAFTESDDPALREKYLDRINDDLEAMEELVEVALDYARMDQQMEDLERKSVDLAKLVDLCVERVSPTEKRINWIRPEKPILVRGDERYLSMLVNNLLNNAGQYAKTNINITLNNSFRNYQLTIEDDGPGIPIEQRSRLVKPFERNIETTKGYGMGLAIVCRITEAFGGRFSIEESTELGGASMNVYLPAESRQALKIQTSRLSEHNNA